MNENTTFWKKSEKESKRRLKRRLPKIEREIDKTESALHQTDEYKQLVFLEEEMKRVNKECEAGHIFAPLVIQFAEQHTPREIKNGAYDFKGEGGHEYYRWFNIFEYQNSDGEIDAYGFFKQGSCECPQREQALKVFRLDPTFPISKIVKDVKRCQKKGWDYDFHFEESSRGNPRRGIEVLFEFETGGSYLPSYFSEKGDKYGRIFTGYDTERAIGEEAIEKLFPKGMNFRWY